MATDNMPTLPFGIPNPFVGGDAAPPKPPAITLNDIVANLPQGATIYAVNGKRALPAADAPLSPRDAIEIVLADSSHYQTLVNGDASDIEEPTLLKAAPKASNPDVRNFGTSTNPDWRQYNSDSKQWEPLSGVGAPAKPAIDAKTQALAQGAIQKIDAGLRPTQGELAALNMVRAAATGGGPATGQPGTFTQTGPGGTGNVNQTPVESAIDQVTDDPRVRMAMKLGAYLEGGLGPSYGAGDGGMSWGPFQINHNQGMHADISRADSEDPVAAANYMLSSYQDAVDKVPAEMWSNDPKQAARLAAYYAERPAQIYDQNRVDAGWNQLFGGGAPGTGGGVDPLTGLPSSLTSRARTLHNVAPGDTVIDQNGNVLFRAPAKPEKGDPMAFLQAQEQSIQYVQQQIAAGTMTTADANGYLQAIKQQTAAGLAGTTPFDIYKQQQDFEYKQAQVGRDLLNNQMTAADNLTRDLLTDKVAGPGYTPLELAQSLTDMRAGNLGPTPTSATAKALIDAFNPANQPNVPQATASALGLPQPNPVMPSPGNEPPLGTTLDDWQAQQNQPQEQAA